jgi:hypothetical protein
MREKQKRVRRHNLPKHQQRKAQHQARKIPNEKQKRRAHK